MGDHSRQCPVQYLENIGPVTEQSDWLILVIGPLNKLSRVINLFIIWLVPRAGKMNQIAGCDWLPERARWSHLARSGLPAVSRKQNFLYRPSLFGQDG